MHWVHLCLHMHLDVLLERSALRLVHAGKDTPAIENLSAKWASMNPVGRMTATSLQACLWTDMVCFDSVRYLCE